MLRGRRSRHASAASRRDRCGCPHALFAFDFARGLSRLRRARVIARCQLRLRRRRRPTLLSRYSALASSPDSDNAPTTTISSLRIGATGATGLTGAATGVSVGGADAAGIRGGCRFVRRRRGCSGAGELMSAESSGCHDGPAAALCCWPSSNELAAAAGCGFVAALASSAASASVLTRGAAPGATAGRQLRKGGLDEIPGRGCLARPARCRVLSVIPGAILGGCARTLQVPAAPAAFEAVAPVLAIGLVAGRLGQAVVRRGSRDPRQQGQHGASDQSGKNGACECCSSSGQFLTPGTHANTAFSETSWVAMSHKSGLILAHIIPVELRHFPHSVHRNKAGFHLEIARKIGKLWVATVSRSMALTDCCSGDNG